MPPLSLLTLVWSAATTVALAGWWFHAAAWPLWLLLVAGGTFGASVVFGWFVHCRRVVPWTTFVRVPWFVLRKVPMYLGLLSRPPGEWVRTARDGEGSRDSEGTELGEHSGCPGVAGERETGAELRPHGEHSEVTR